MTAGRVRGALVVVADEGALWAALADIFVEDAREAVARRGSFAVALSGGTTPKGAYELLAQEPRRSRVPWERLSIFFSDERCVPPGDPQSNYGMAHDALLSKVPVPAEHVHRMRGELPPEEAAGAYASVLRDALGDDPVFDLVMLGMGPDGHTASLFPGTSPVGEQRLLVAAPFVPKFGAHRLTMTPRVLNRARHVVVAAAGAEKSEALRRAIEGPFDPNLTPVQVVQPAAGALTWLADRAAAARLTTPPG
ncbi:MAG TPA: 6-phosphogluconolactonase [Candidatus Dormibacteraeota bacterium]|nr:6-phosphogluconolactonase [Candidatus Dormibacteraeota bacterium]